MWKQLGVETSLLNSEVKVHYKDLQEGNFQVARAGWIADYNDAQNFLYLMDSATGVLNYAAYANPEYDRLMGEAAKTADLHARADLLRQAEAIAMDDMPNVPIYLLHLEEPGLACGPGLGRQHQGHPSHALPDRRALSGFWGAVGRCPPPPAPWVGGRWMKAPRRVDE